MTRDFTYIDDLVEAIVRLKEIPPAEDNRLSNGDTLSPTAPYRVVNIGSGEPIVLLEFVKAIEDAVGKRAAFRLLPMQPGDVPITFANPRLLEVLTGYRPRTSITDGVNEFVSWYRGYYR